MAASRAVGGALVAILAWVTGCGGSSSSPRQPPASARARESTIAKSKLPGASGVGAALRVSDSAAARRAREAEAGAEPP